MKRCKGHRHGVHVSWSLGLQRDLSKWHVAKVADMACMFYGASAFNGDLNKWYVAKVTDMPCMLYGAPAFNGDLSKWYVAKATDMENMCYCASHIGLAFSSMSA